VKIEKTIKKLQRKLQLSMLGKSSPEGLRNMGEKKLLRTFQKQRFLSPALKNALEPCRIGSKGIKTIEHFTALEFTMSKENTFNKYPLKDLCRPGILDNLQGVLTSSGHSGNFAFGLTTWKQAKATPDLLDLALQSAFQIDQKKTLLVNCLPMGVRFPSNCVTLAEVSVREDMALALIQKFSSHFDQIIIVCDPLFLKLLMDESGKWQIDWCKIHKHLIIGEETFGENYRNYIGKKINIDPDDLTSGIIGSSMGVGELGLNLCFETLETITLRRAINKSPPLKKKLFGCLSEYDPLPMLFTYNPLSTYMEVKHSDDNGYGPLLVSLLDKSCPIPLFRYQTGDEAKLLNSDEILTAFQDAELPAPILPKLPLICIRGRQKDRLSSGLHMGVVKDALFHDHHFADQITGAFRMDKDAPDKLHIQLRRGIKPDEVQPNNLFCGDKIIMKAKNIRLWTYEDFPYGKSIDYERKFTYLA